MNLLCWRYLTNEIGERTSMSGGASRSGRAKSVKGLRKAWYGNIEDWPQRCTRRGTGQRERLALRCKTIYFVNNKNRKKKTKMLCVCSCRRGSKCKARPGGGGRRRGSGNASTCAALEGKSAGPPRTGAHWQTHAKQGYNGGGRAREGAAKAEGGACAGGPQACQGAQAPGATGGNKSFFG